MDCWAYCESPGRRHQEVILRTCSLTPESLPAVPPLLQSSYRYLPFQFQGEAGEF
nr:MAG TPA: hypothetical protein [Caudoviricetes sp.]